MLSVNTKLDRNATTTASTGGQGVTATLAQAFQDVWQGITLPAATITSNLEPEEKVNPLSFLLTPNPMRMLTQATKYGIEEAGRAIENRTKQDQSASTKDRNHWDRVAAEEMLEVRIAQTQTGNLGAQKEDAFAARGTGNLKADIVNEYLTNAAELPISHRTTSTARELPKKEDEVTISFGGNKTLSGNFVVQNDGSVLVLDGQIDHSDGNRSTSLREFTLPAELLKSKEKEITLTS